MIVLHNRHDKASREFVANRADITVLDWYNDADRDAWLAAGGTLAVSTFPSVLMRHDKTETEEPGWDTVRLPGSLDTPLPAVGQECPAGLYKHADGWVICRQAHTRQADWEPGAPGMAALFSVWRPDAPGMVWIPSETVGVGDIRIYDGAEYECLQAHVTQSDWTPPAVPALWRAVVAPSAEWQAGVAYKVGDRVLYAGVLYECRQSHTAQVGWEPPKVLALWLPI